MVRVRVRIRVGGKITVRFRVRLLPGISMFPSPSSVCCIYVMRR